MRYTGESIERTLRLAYAEHRVNPSTQTSTQLAKLRALRALYESSVYARIWLPGLGEAQRSLREATELYRILRSSPSAEQRELRQLKRTIQEVRKVPMELPELDFTV